MTEAVILETEHRIDEVIATCNDDARGAIRALLLVNERLEKELQHLYALLQSPAAVS